MQLRKRKAKAKLKAKIMRHADMERVAEIRDDHQECLNSFEPANSMADRHRKKRKLDSSQV